MICTSCAIEKPYTDFYGHNRKCKRCMSNAQRERYAQKKQGPLASDEWHRLSNVSSFEETAHCSKCGPAEIFLDKGQWRCKKGAKDGRRNRDLQKLYAMTLKDFNVMLEDQGNCCAICKRTECEFVVDHDHRCCPGKVTCGECVRAIICNPCNAMLGHIETNGFSLQTVQEYLGR